MKKRLLSAALALAMVLAMIPATTVPAFAATTTSSSAALPSSMASYTNASGQTIYRYNPGTNTSVNVSQYLGQGEAYGRVYGRWYWLDNADPQNQVYYEVQEGVVMGTAQDETVTNGQWWAASDLTTTVNGVTNLRGTNFTILGNTTVTLPANAASVNVNFSEVNNNIGTLDVSSATKISSITVKTTNSTIGKKGTVNGLSSINRAAYPGAGQPTPSGLTLNATNVTIASGLSLTGRTNNVTLNNCSVGGGITMDGTTVTAVAPSTVNTYYGQTLNVTSSTCTSAVSVTGDGSQVNLTNVNAASLSGSAQALSVTGVGGSVNIGGTSQVGQVTVHSRATSASPNQYNTIPTVNVTGGDVSGITTVGEQGNGTATINISRSTTGFTNISAAITAAKANLSVSGGASIATAQVDEGSVTLTGPVTSTGALTLGDSGATSLSITGAGINLNGITVNSGKGENLNITQWPTTRDNYYGTLALNDYAKGQINGGTFACPNAMPFGTEAEKRWFNTTNLTYRAFVNGRVALYNADELARAIQDVAPADVKTAGNLMPIGQSTGNTITFKWGKDNVAVVAYSALTPVILPTELNSQKISTWMWMSDETPPKLIKSLVPGTSENFPTTYSNITLVADGASETVSQINRITGGVGTSVSGGNIRASVSDNSTIITLTGAVPEGVSGITGVTLDLTTDAVGADGEVIKLTGVPVEYDNKTKTARFATIWAGQNGARTEDGKLILSNGTAYTVNGSGLAISATNLGLVAEDTNGYPIEVNVGGKLSGWNKDAKDALTTLLSGGTAGMKIAADCTAWLETINAAQATITSTQTVTSWRDNARNQIWTQGYKSPLSSNNTAVNGYAVATSANTSSTVTSDYSLVRHSGSYTQNATAADKAAIGSLFSNVYIVPYLQVNVTDYDAGNGTLEATLVPSYRVEVSAATYNKNFAYVAQAGRALSDLTGVMGGGITVKFNLGGTFTSQKMHQDGKYVYASSTAGGQWTMTHAGGTGLGSIVINGTDGLITLQVPTATGAVDTYALASVACKYDSVQAAVDDTIPERKTSNSDDTMLYSTVNIDGGFSGSAAFDMTGVARTIKVVANGNQSVSCTSNYVDAPQVNGMTYTFQLKRDVATPTARGNITINSATGGSAAVSANPAAVGQTVTITLTPAAGYVSNGVAVRNAAGQTVAVTGSGNVYTFVMPSGTVTVTPAFMVGTTTPTQATVNVSSNAAGGVTTTAAATNNRVTPGSTVGVTTYPASGYRTMGVNITTNGGATTAVRTGDNSFTFTVPSNATAVTVTPTYDRDNGTKFSDVWSTEYYSAPVAWAVGKGVTTGTSTYTFSPTVVCNRAQMVTFLYRAAGSPAVGNVRNPFVDVPASEYYYNAVLWAVSKGITNGVDATHFAPGQTVTRAQAVTFLYRYAGQPAAGTNSGFYDVPSNQYYARAVTWAANKGITNGTTSTTFSPSAGCQRAQIVTFLYRDLNNIRA